MLKVASVVGAVLVIAALGAVAAATIGNDGDDGAEQGEPAEPGAGGSGSSDGTSDGEASGVSQVFVGTAIAEPGGVSAPARTTVVCEASCTISLDTDHYGLNGSYPATGDPATGLKIVRQQTGSPCDEGHAFLLNGGFAFEGIFVITGDAIEGLIHSDSVPPGGGWMDCPGGGTATFGGGDVTFTGTQE